MSGSGGDPFADMRSPVTPLIGPAEAAAQRSRVIVRMQLLQESARQKRAAAHVTRRRLRAAFAALAISAAVACAWAFQRGGPDTPVTVTAPFIDPSSLDATVVRGDLTVTARANAPLPLRSSDRIRTVGGGATLKLRSGASVELNAATDLQLVQDERSLEEVLLKQGHVDVRVPKLARGELLVVRTPDSSVTVRGTHFTVSFDLGCKSRPCTSVNVAEGRVEVEHAGAVVMLGSGDSWTSEDTTSPESSTPRGAAVAPAAAARAAGGLSAEPPPRRLPPKTGTRVAAERSTLAEENALLEHAMTASRAGHPERAVSLLDEHMEKYPGSQLARNAELERLRALERAGNLATARAAARRYLAKYPDGMGSDEARRIALARHSRGSGPPAGP